MRPSGSNVAAAAQRLLFDCQFSLHDVAPCVDIQQPEALQGHNRPGHHLLHSALDASGRADLSSATQTARLFHELLAVPRYPEGHAGVFLRPNLPVAL
jgi:hypothetical protein